MATTRLTGGLWLLSMGSLLAAVWGAWLWWRVMHSPGDDNPIAMLGVLVAGGAGSLAAAFAAAAVLTARRRR